MTSLSRRRHRQRPPPAPPRLREKPLLGNLTAIASVSSRYVRTHVGVEAAAALLLAGLLTIIALGYICQAFVGYSLCCFSRGKSRERRDDESDYYM